MFYSIDHRRRSLHDEIINFALFPLIESAATGTTTAAAASPPPATTTTTFPTDGGGDGGAAADNDDDGVTFSSPSKNVLQGLRSRSIFRIFTFANVD